jgi:NADPH:quinone reductase-like Zn-dependent oxidoreductase
VHNRDGWKVWGKRLACTHALYTIKATTVLPKRELDECREPEMDIENRLYESNFVGTVTNIDSKASQSNLVRGDQVTSIRKCGTKARFVTMPADSLVVLPENLDVGEAVSVISTFLPAFGALHHGRRECRFLPDSLYNKKVLVTGGTLLEAQAVVKLAIWGGASAVYMLSSSTQVPIKVKGNRVTLLPDDKEIWLPLVQQKMDVVVDYDFPNHFGSVTKALGLNGRLVCQSKSRSKGQRQDWLVELEQGFVSEYDSALEMAALCILSNSFLFNFEGICDNNTGELEVSQYRLDVDV